MKRIVSVSIGSSTRDTYVETKILGQEFIIERRGTNGCFRQALDLIRGLDGKVDALGMGGIDLYLWADKKRYTLRSAIPLKKAARQTPIVDGSGLKNTLERDVIKYLVENNIVDFKNNTTLITSAMDRFGMAETIAQSKGKIIIGDLIFALSWDRPLYTLTNLRRVASFLAPLACQLPFKMLYPVDNLKNVNKIKKLERYYNEANIIAGDFHYIKGYMPDNLKNKTIITNTITKKDIKMLQNKGVSLLITTTPKLGDRSFGTNVMEAVIVSIIGEDRQKNYEEIIKTLKFQPRIEYLQGQLNM